jgi:hypothetical protein
VALQTFLKPPSLPAYVRPATLWPSRGILFGQTVSAVFEAKFSLKSVKRSPLSGDFVRSWHSWQDSGKDSPLERQVSVSFGHEMDGEICVTLIPFDFWECGKDIEVVGLG